MPEEKKVEEVTEEAKVVETPVVEETNVEIKAEDISITATSEETDTTGEAKNISQDEPKVEEVKEEPKKVEPDEKKEDTLKVAFADQQKQLEEMRSLLDGLKKANEELINKNKELVEKNEKFEKDISELRESPFYKSSTTTADRAIKGSREFTQDDLAKLRNKI